MKIKVVHNRCGKVFDWTWGKQRGICPYCHKTISIMDVKMAQGEVVKLFE